MTKIVCISDVHNRYDHLKMPAGDILVCTGDMLGRGTLLELHLLNNWFGTLDFKHVVLIAGNHDWCFQEYPEAAQLACTNCTYLQDEGVTILGLHFYGSPWQPEFFDWAFNLPRGNPLKEKWDCIPNDIDVLLTHGPAQGTLDLVPEHGGFVAVGCEELMYAIERVKPRLHVFGHIHFSYGIAASKGTTSVNASICTENYKPNNLPIVIVL